MAITRPVTRTIISTTGWGIPITDAVNALATEPGWTNITYMNGFTTYSGYAPLSYRKVGDLVFLRGGVVPGPVNTPMGQLPPTVRPQYNVEVITYGYGGDIQFAQLVIALNGNISYGKNAAVPTLAFLSCQTIPWLPSGV